MGKRLKVAVPEHEDPSAFSGPRRPRDLGRLASRVATTVFIVAFIAVLVMFMALNFRTHVDTLRLFPGQRYSFSDIPLVIIVPFSVLCGILFATVLSTAARVKHGLVNRRLQRQVRRLEKEIESLRQSIPPGPSEAAPVLEGGRPLQQGD